MIRSEALNILEINEKDLETKDLNNIYKELKIKWHPDRNPGCQNAHEKFCKITEAYNFLLENPKEISSKKEIFDSAVVVADILSEKKVAPILNYCFGEKGPLIQKGFKIFSASAKNHDKISEEFGESISSLTDLWKKRHSQK